MRRLRDILLTILVIPLLFWGISYVQEPGQLTGQMMVSGQQSSAVEGIPEAIQGVWFYQGERIDQELVLRGNQMIVTDDMSGTIYYAVRETQITRVEGDDNLTTYTLYTDIDDYQARYIQGNEESGLMPTESFVFTYDLENDVILPQSDAVFRRQPDRQLHYVVADLLVENQPINREILREVEPAKLVEFYQSVVGGEKESGEDEIDEIDVNAEAEVPATDEFDVSVDVSRALYDRLAEEFPDLALLSGDDYDAYFSIFDEIASHTDFTLRRLNQAGPRWVLNEYDEVGAVDESFIESLEIAIQDYQTRQFNYENSLRLVFE